MSVQSDAPPELDLEDFGDENGNGGRETDAMDYDDPMLMDSGDMPESQDSEEFANTEKGTDTRGLFGDSPVQLFCRVLVCLLSRLTHEEGENKSTCY